MQMSNMENNLRDNLNYINSIMRMVKYDEDLTLIENKQERLILELKRNVQDCTSTLECEGSGINNQYLNELEYYIRRLLNELSR